MPATPNIFVSYARVDKGTASAVVQALQGAGLTVWWDADIPLGPKWQDVLQDKLNDCGAFLLLVGHQGVPGWIQAEVGVALSRHFSRNTAAPMPIVPVLLGDTPERLVPPFLSLFQCHHLEDARDPAHITELLTGVRDCILVEGENSPKQLSTATRIRSNPLLFPLLGTGACVDHNPKKNRMQHI